MEPVFLTDIFDNHPLAIAIVLLIGANGYLLAKKHFDGRSPSH